MMEPVKATANASELTTFANDVHGYLRQNVTWADQKAAFMFAGSVSFLAYLNANHAFNFLRGDVCFEWRHLVLGASAICLLITAFGAFVTYWPTTKGMRAGLVFWGAIAMNESGAAYVKRVGDCTAVELAAAKLEHSYELATICERKFKWVDASTRFGIAGFALAIIYLLAWL